ncbi:unnamed protein product [Parascedosporium putredinis]|uniref:ubiquitinyl hydrolase 1 n=1 Tax=Parascedosporium putredinis TaxID=1442378 RepID=A0A9P1M9E0_9PEZI|nr:unnamed protein product [Parascedosporium putredinis]CAI7994659.1 unnamed protein product [Parascedosporium putredinis]
MDLDRSTAEDKDLGDPHGDGASSGEQAGSAAVAASPPSRRNPKRSASKLPAATLTPAEIPENVMDAALAPLDPNELDEWTGWAVFESDPVGLILFHTYLGRLGVKDVRVTDAFDIVDESLDPEYAQTVDNSCATVAMLNILMNSPGLELGPELTRFKDQTKDMNSVQRGKLLSENTAIRVQHNLLSRRMEHLNADLWLHGSAMEYQEGVRRANKRAKKKGRSKKRPVGNDAFHYVSYVPVDGNLWKFDGLQVGAVDLGPISEIDIKSTMGSSRGWWEDALSDIQDRTSNLGFDVESVLLAVRHDPISHIRHQLARAIRSVREISERRRRCPCGWQPTLSEPGSIDVGDASQLARFGLSEETVTAASLCPSDRHAVEMMHVMDFAEKYRMHEAYAERCEMDTARRKKEYVPAIHAWVKKLAEKGVLADFNS